MGRREKLKSSVSDDQSQSIDIALVPNISRYNLLYSKFSLGHFSAIFDDSQHFTYRCHVFFVNAAVLVVNFNWKYPSQTNQTNQPIQNFNFSQNPPNAGPAPTPFLRLSPLGHPEHCRRRASYW